MKPTDRQMKLTPREWLISILVHLTVLGLLIWFTPAREIITSLTQKNPPPAAKSPPPDPTKVKEAAQAIAHQQASEAQKHVSELLDLEKTIDDLAKERMDSYQEQKKVLAADAAKKALDLVTQIPPSQDTTLQAQDQLGQKLQTLLPADANAPIDLKTVPQLRHELDVAKQAITQSQVKIQEDQTKAVQMLHFLGTDSDAARLQEKANAAQNAAAQSQEKVIKAQEQLFNNLTAQTRETENLAQSKERLVQIQNELDRLNARIAQQQPALDAAKAQLDAASAQNPSDPQAKRAAQDAVQQARQTYNQLKATQDRDTNPRNAQQVRLQSEQVHQKQVADALAAAQAQIVGLRAQLQAAANASKSEQQSAKQAQVDAVAQLTVVVNSPPPAPAPFQTPPELATDKEPTEASLQDKNLGQLYETARAVEDRITDKYKVYRAAEFASIQRLTLEDALKNTQVAKPNRVKLDVPLLSGKGAAKNFEAYKSEVLKANQQIKSMIGLTTEMIATAQDQKGVGSGDVILQSAQYDQMVSSALDDPNAAGKDLTQLTGKGSGIDGKGTSLGQAGGPLGGNVGAGKSFSRNAAELPTVDERNPQGFATRVISDSGSHHSPWLYVDSWYFIGPFPNQGRDNLHTKFPPESVIDLDAIYPGKNGRPLRWIYTQWNSPKIVPPNDSADAPAIYYAYTELYFDHPRNLWIATGSDDKGTMWFNDVMVWNSNDILKGWRPNEGYRKVHFNQGLNRILYRLENGQQAAAFSLMISTKTE